MNDADTNHSALVVHAARWLRKSCSVVITELVTTGEIPDAIGWRGTHSTVIECKASRSDFWADAAKEFRINQWMGAGCSRYYLAPDGLIPVSEIPDKWGLLELTAYGIQVTRKSEHFGDGNTRHEIGMLLSAIRRIGRNAPAGISVKCYAIETRNTATLGILDLDAPFSAPEDGGGE